jgi:hypothetical protein
MSAAVDFAIALSLPPVFDRQTDAEFATSPLFGGYRSVFKKPELSGQYAQNSCGF